MGKVKELRQSIREQAERAFANRLPSLLECERMSPEDPRYVRATISLKAAELVVLSPKQWRQLGGEFNRTVRRLLRQDSSLRAGPRVRRVLRQRDSGNKLVHEIEHASFWDPGRLAENNSAIEIALAENPEKALFRGLDITLAIIGRSSGPIDASDSEVALSCVHPGVLGQDDIDDAREYAARHRQATGDTAVADKVEEAIARKSVGFPKRFSVIILANGSSEGSSFR